jgi:hypothetical protein
MQKGWRTDRYVHNSENLDSGIQTEFGGIISSLSHNIGVTIG